MADRKKFCSFVPMKNLQSQKRTFVSLEKKLLDDLVLQGGDRLVAYYILLLHHVGQHGFIAPYTAKNNRKIRSYRLIKSKVPFFSIATIKKYHKQLEKMGVAWTGSFGTEMIAAQEKVAEIYGTSYNVSIPLSKGIIDTAENVFIERLRENIELQKQVIELKKELVSIREMNPKDKHRGVFLREEKIRERYKINLKEDEAVEPEVLISLNKIALIKNPSNPSFSSAIYWKRKLKKKGKIETKRRFRAVQSMNYKEYEFYKRRKKLRKLFPGIATERLQYIGGYLCEELTSSIRIVSCREQFEAQRTAA